MFWVTEYWILSAGGGDPSLGMKGHLRMKRTKMIRKAAATASAAVAAGAMALALAPAASAVAPGYDDVTDQFTSYDEPGAFNPGVNPVIVSSYGTATAIGCIVDGAVWRTCYQEGWNHEPHQVHYLANVNGHGTWATVDLPQGFEIPQLPVVELPAGSVAGSIGNLVTGSAGSTSPGAGLNLDITSSLGDIGLGLGTGSAG